MKTPTANVTILKNRVKIHECKDAQIVINNVFMENNQEFEIELFNPLQEKIVAKVYLNNEDISNNEGIILKPGQRVFLERFLKSNNRFKFSTYTVEANNKDVDSAIAKNGDIRIEFFKEIKKCYSEYYTITTTNINYPIFPYDNRFYYDHQAKFTANIQTTPTYQISQNERSLCMMDKSVKETGRIEEGSYSNQSFGSEYFDIASYPFHTINYKILPASEKKYITTDEIDIFCTECGRKKRKNSHKYCPHCGTKY